MTLVDDIAYPNLQYFTADKIHSGKAAAVFTTRNGGVSGSNQGLEYLSSLNLQYNAQGENNDNVDRNYDIIADALHFGRKHIYTVNQKHTDNIVIVDKAAAGADASSFAGKDADALITDIPGILLSVRTADCVPILLFDPENNVAAAIHSGWRGTYQNIAAKTLARMSEIYKSNPKNIRAAAGPAIGTCCYEVGLDIYEKFHGKYGDLTNKYFDIISYDKPHCDLPALNKALLIQAGVLDENIEIADMCTLCNPDLFYSHRRSGFKRGAMAAFIGIRR